jgi:hypothetical protein
MPRTILAYTDEISDALKALPKQKQFFFCVWCAQQLFDEYGAAIPEILSKEAYQEATLLLNYLWQQVDNFDTFDAEELEQNIERTEMIDEDGLLDLGDTIENGISNLQGAIMNSLQFLQDKNTALAVGVAHMIITVIDGVMTNDLGLNTANPDKHFDHPLMKEALDRQMQLIEHAKKGAALSSADKNIFRTE